MVHEHPYYIVDRSNMVVRGWYPYYVVDRSNIWLCEVGVAVLRVGAFHARFYFAVARTSD